MKKTIAVLLSALLLLQTAALFACAVEADTHYTVYNLQRDGLTQYWTDENGERVELTDAVSLQSEEPEDNGAAVYPESYYCTAVTEVKNQEPAANCWAYSTISVLESDYILNGYGNRANTDFSESHLTWFALRGLVTGDDPTAGDGMLIDQPYDYGGSFLMAVAALARGAGITTEAKFPMDPDYFPSYTQDQMYVSDARLENALFLSTKNDIKQAVMDNGGVAICISIDSVGLNIASGECYNGVTGQTSSTITTVNHRLNLKPNHALTVVGWDDNFPRGNFGKTVMPSKNGAWLCKNSWGDYGDDGYLWVSYEDCTVTDAMTLTAAKKNLYDTIYQYDGFGYGSSIKVTQSDAALEANIFTAAGTEYLTHVGFYTLEDNLDYKIYVYTGLSEGCTRPSVGHPALVHTGNAEFAGYHTVDLGDYVSLTAGERYAVIIEFPIQGSSSVEIPVEGKTVTTGGVTSGYSSTVGTSFIGYIDDDGLAWTDTTEAGYNNVCIKAMTQKKRPVSVSELNNGATLVDNTTRVRVTYAPGNFVTAPSLYVSYSTAAASAVSALFSNKYAETGSKGYKISFTVGGNEVSAAKSGFTVTLPVPDTSVKCLYLAQISEDGSTVRLYRGSLDGDLLSARVDSLSGSFAVLYYGDEVEGQSTGIQEQVGILSYFKNLLKQIIAFFKKLFGIE